MNSKKFIAANTFLLIIWICTIIYWVYFPIWIYNNVIKFNISLMDTIVTTTFFTMIFMSSMLIIYFPLKNDIENYLLKRLS